MIIDYFGNLPLFKGREREGREGRRKTILFDWKFKLTNICHYKIITHTHTDAHYKKILFIGEIGKLEHCNSNKLLMT